MQDQFLFPSEIGEIVLSKSVFTKMVLDAAKAVPGDRLTVATTRGKTQGFTTKIGMTEEAVTVDVKEGNRLELKVDVLVRFGSSIRETTDFFHRELHRGLKAIVGKGPKKVTVTVVGMVSKNIAKRNIEIVRDYAD